MRERQVAIAGALVLPGGIAGATQGGISAALLRALL